MELTEEIVNGYLATGHVESPEMLAELDRQRDDPESLLSRMSARMARAARQIANPEGPLMGLPDNERNGDE